MQKRRWERFQLAAAVAGLLWAHPALASTPTIKLRPTQAPTRLAAPAAGIDAWLESTIASRGRLAPIANGAKAGQAPSNPVGSADTTQLQVHLTWNEGNVAVVAFHGATAASGPADIARHVGPLEELGRLVETATFEVLPALAASRSHSKGPMSIGALTQLGHARAAFDSGRLADGWKLLTRNRSAAAERLREQILKKARDPSTPVTERSRLGSALGKPDTDWLEIRNGISAGQDVRYLIAGAEAASARGDRARAGRFYRRALSLDPSHPEALRGLALMLAETREAGKARKAAERALAVRPDDPEVLAALAANPTLSEEAQSLRLRDLGDIHASQWQSQAAFDAWKQASPAHVASRRAHHLANLGRHEEADEAFEAAVVVAPSDSSAWTGLGDRRLANGDSQGAGSAFEQAIAITPTNADALAGLGQSLLDNDEPASAIVSLERAIEISPTHASARRQLARGLHTSGRSEQALKVLDPTAVAEEERSGLLLDAAQLQHEAGDLTSAQASLEAAIQIEPTSAPLHVALASVYEEQGNPEAAAREQHLGVRLAVQGPASEPEKKGTTERILGSRYDALIASLEAGRPLERVVLLGVNPEPGPVALARRLAFPRVLDHSRLEAEILASMAARFPIAEFGTPGEAETIVETLQAFSTDADSIATAISVLECDAIVVGRLQRRQGSGLHLELRLLVGGGGPMQPVSILANALPLAQVGAQEHWNATAMVLPLALTLGLGLLLRRGWGTLVVELNWDQDPKRKGLFNIEVSRRPGQVQSVNRKDRGRASRGFGKRGLQNRFKRNLVGSVTRLGWLPAQRYYVCVHGLLQDTDTGEVIGNFLEERSIVVERGRVATAPFDFRARECPVRILLPRPQGTENATVIVGLAAGNTEPRYVRDEEVILSLEPGQYTLRAGFLDRAFEVDLRVEDHAAKSVQVRLGDTELALFSGCAEAVEPFVLGDLAVASKHLAAAGLSGIANRLQAEHLEQRGETADAAELFEAAGDLTTAARLRAEDSDPMHAATLLKESGDFSAAATLLEGAGDFQQAGEAFEAAYDYESALDAYRAAGALPKALELLEKLGRPFEAAVVADDLGENERAIQNFQQVDIRDPDYAKAAVRLSGAFAEREQWALAAEKLQEGIGTNGTSNAPLDLLERLASYQEQAGDITSAIETCEAILRRDLSHPGLDERIRELRQRSQSQTTEVHSPPNSGARPDEASLEERYEIRGELGRGGMGIVYEARDLRLGRIVALKRLPESLHDNPMAVKLFLREARSAAALNHPNIVTLFDAGQAGDIYYLTMELLEGQALNQIQKARGKLRPIDAARLGVQISAGLEYAHANRIVHRDIKTSNLFFTKDKVVKIMDFGLAKMIEEVRRGATVIGGTPYYMAPEQSAGENVDHRADLYAFGVTLFQLLTNSLPFRDGDVAYHHRHTPAPDPREHADGIPAELAELILELMAKSREDRPAETAEVKARLESIAASLARSESSQG
ncbi:MAG: protein kinase [bacterium]|nr:protein kinase [bacterium]